MSTKSEGLSHVQKAVVFEEAGYSWLGPTALNIHAPDEGNIHLMEEVATPDQKERWLRPQVQGLIRFQPFAQALDAPIRLYLGGGGFLLTLCVQLGWLLALSWLGRAMWRRELLRVTIQGG